MSLSTVFSTDPFGFPHAVSTVTVPPADPTSTDTATDTATSPSPSTTNPPTPTNTATTTATDTNTATATNTDTNTNTASNTVTNTNTATDTATDTNTATNTDTATNSNTDTNSASASSTTVASSTTGTSTTLSSTGTSATASATSAGSTVYATSTDAGGRVVTHTSLVFATPTVSSSAAASGSHTSKSFFQNTGAVAGVFTVVGLAVVVLIVAIVTNALRRRRAKRLDREIAEAAAEAAHAPAFTDDDYYPDDRLGGGGKGGSPGTGGADLRSYTTGYSDTTHGTYAQPPMSTAESYNMAELQPHDYAAGAAAAGGAAGIGAMGVNRARSMGQNTSTPYNAFAGPPPGSVPNPYENYGQQNMHYGGQHGGNDMDLLDAAGLAGGAAAGYTTAQQPYGGQQQQNLARNPSLGPSAVTSPSEHSAYSSPYSGQGAYAQPEYNPYAPAQNAQGYNPYAQPSAYPPQPYNAPAPSPPRPTSIVDPYGGYVDEPAHQPSPSPPAGNNQSQIEPRVPSPGPGRLLSGNFASPPASSEGHDHDDNGRMSIQDDDDYGYEPRRVLKVANE